MGQQSNDITVRYITKNQRPATTVTDSHPFFNRDRRFPDRQPASFSLERKENEAKETLFISVSGILSPVGDCGCFEQFCVAVATKGERPQRKTSFSNGLNGKGCGSNEAADRTGSV
ncbi:MAG: hypothetical protein BA864_00215 [Desulfuromonadales bacterium C00003093]|nr:MAG: hypothetical protein BA864_00215 [Desulfuromonadales bacterium C00003093]